VFFKHRNRASGAGEQKSGHHARWAAADDQQVAR
jgi:hypothetical protein